MLGTYFTVETRLPHGGVSISAAIPNRQEAQSRAAQDAAYYLGPDMYGTIQQRIDEHCCHCHGEGSTHHTKGKRPVRRFTKRCEVCHGAGTVNAGELVTVSR